MKMIEKAEQYIRDMENLIDSIAENIDSGEYSDRELINKINKDIDLFYEKYSDDIEYSLK